MENKILMLLCIVVVILFYLLVYYRNKANKIYTESDKLLDKILENSHIDQIEVNEGKTSALASKISKVQEKLLIETGRAENEKEQIKCLISNMSHQLKTPLANVIMYEDIIHFLRREMLDFTAFPVFFVSNLLLVQRKKYYFNRATVSRNCSIVL